MTLEDRLKGAVYSAMVGDALGVPVEFTPRQELSLCSVKNMLGYGRYDQPEGTWSDDTSMIVCTIESLAQGYDVEHMAKTFCKWLFDAYWTPCGYVFDAGLTTFMALDSIHTEGRSAKESGCRTEDDNGNGSLMRILPAALFFHKDKLDKFLQHIHEVAGITHAHPRAQIGCGIYSLLVRELLAGTGKESAYRNAVGQGLEYYNRDPEFKRELSHYMRVLSYEIPALEESDINSSGYIVDTLEAGIWCLMRFNDTRSVLLAAVNLGLDTDTTGTVAGGLAGTAYGLETVPPEWLQALARKQEIDGVVERFVASVVR